MVIKRPKPEEIVVKLRQVEVLMGQGMPRIDAIRQLGVTEQKLLLLEEEVWRNGHRTTQGTEAASERERAPSPRRFGS